MADTIRVLLAKPTQDCHDRGVRYVARKFRDAGLEVIFSNFLLASEIVHTAVQEDVHVIGVSVSAGGHMPVFEDLIAAMKENGPRRRHPARRRRHPPGRRGDPQGLGRRRHLRSRRHRRRRHPTDPRRRRGLNGKGNNPMAAKKDAFSRISILGGGGLMGHGIALACLQGSAAEVVLISRRQETVDHGLDLIQSGPFGLSRAVERGKLSEEDATAIGERVRGTTDYADGLKDVDLVFETIPEIVATKQDVLRQAEDLVGDGRSSPPTRRRS